MENIAYDVIMIVAARLMSEDDFHRAVEIVKDKFIKATRYIASRYPYFLLVIKVVNVKVNDASPTMAADDDSFTIKINPIFGISISNIDALAMILVHEALHIMLAHSARYNPVYECFWNICTDTKVNQILNDISLFTTVIIEPTDMAKKYIEKAIDKLSTSSKEAYDTCMSVIDSDKVCKEVVRFISTNKDLLKKAFTAPHIASPVNPGTIASFIGVTYEDLAEMSVEDICEALKAKAKEKECVNFLSSEGDGGKLTSDKTPKPIDTYPASKKAKGRESTIQSGPYRTRPPKSTIADIMKELKQSMKTWGTESLGVSRIVEGLEMPEEYDWRSLLINILQTWYSQVVVETWKKPSRRLPLTPGKKFLGPPPCYILLDASSSISEDELKLFVGTVLDIVSSTGATLYVIPFDTQPYGVMKVESEADIEELKKFIKGGGGTYIKSTLEYLYNKLYVPPFYPLIILTDGAIGDFYVGDKYTLNVLSSLQRVLLATTDQIPFRLPRNVIVLKLRRKRPPI